MINIWNTIVAPTLPYLIGLIGGYLYIKVITLGVDDDDYFCDM